MAYNFDEIINREGTGSLKYDIRKQKFSKKMLFPCGLLIWISELPILLWMH